MTRETGGERSLAPVIPLFGDGAFSRGSVSRGSVSRDNGLLGEDRGEACAELSAGTWHSTWVDDDDIGEDDDDRYLDDPYGESRASSAVTRAALDRLIKRLPIQRKKPGSRDPGFFYGGRQERWRRLFPARFFFQFALQGSPVHA